MKRVEGLLILAAFFLLLSPGFAQDKVQGGYRDCTVFKYIFETGVLNIETKVKVNLLKYDVNGNKIQEITYDTSGAVTDYLTCEYDSVGRKILTVFFTSSDSVISRRSYKYDDRGHAFQKVNYHADGSIEWKDSCIYDRKGNMIEDVKCNYNMNGQVISIESNTYNFKYKYDSKGNLIDKSELTPDGTIGAMVTYMYDDLNNITEKIEYKNPKEPIFKMEYVYEK